MTIHATSDTPNGLEITWEDGSANLYCWLWLRDNCPTGFHPDTGERIFDLLSVPDTLTGISDLRGDGSVAIDWTMDNEGSYHRSVFDGRFLETHRPGTPRADAAAITPVVWDRSLGADGIPRHDAGAILGDDRSLLAWMTDTVSHGLSIVEGLADDPEAGMDIARRAGFLRQTNFGVTFEVINKPDPNNLAYTAHALPLHIDLTNQELPPGFQFLHAIANEADGGGSTFADGMALCAALREADAEAHDVLARTPVPMRFFDRETDIRGHYPVIGLDPDGQFRELRYNAHIADIPDLPADRMHRFYLAYRKLMALTRDPRFVLETKLNAGEMVVFDNRRVMHGRAEFDPSTGYRHLRGCYVDRGEMYSRIRVLSR